MRACCSHLYMPCDLFFPVVDNFFRVWTERFLAELFDTKKKNKEHLTKMCLSMMSQLKVSYVIFESSLFCKGRVQKFLGFCSCI